MGSGGAEWWKERELPGPLFLVIRVERPALQSQWIRSVWQICGRPPRLKD